MINHCDFAHPNLKTQTIRLARLKSPVQLIFRLVTSEMSTYPDLSCGYLLSSVSADERRHSATYIVALWETRLRIILQQNSRSAMETADKQKLRHGVNRQQIKNTVLYLLITGSLAPALLGQDKETNASPNVTERIQIVAGAQKSSEVFTFS